MGIAKNGEGCLVIIVFQQLKKLIGIGLFASSRVVAQSWIGSDDFNSSVLDATKWSYYSGSMQLPLSQNFIKTNTGISFYSSLDIGESWGIIFYKPVLPTNVNWSAQVEAKIESSFSTNNSDHYVDALITVASDLDSFNSYFTNCLHKDSTQNIVPNWSTSSGNNEEIKIPIQLSNVILRFDYIASTKTLIASYANPATPNTFTTVKTLNVGSWGESLHIGIGGYSWDCAVSPAVLTMDNFQVSATALIPADSPTEYTYSGVNEITIDRYIGTATAVVIPSQIDGKPVVKIGNYAFNNCTNITSVKIPETIKTIGDNAFTNCSSLAEITIPDSVTLIKTSAFIDCKNLFRANLGAGFHTIGYHMFYNCWNLQEINIPSNITSIGYEAFYECYALKKMVIPDSVTYIDPTAFKYCTGLESISIGSGISSIGDYMFYGLGSLKNVSLSSGVTNIGSNAFGWCFSLEKLILPNSVTSISGSTFNNCLNLSYIDLGDGLTMVPDTLFKDAASLKTVVIGKQVSDIGISAFQGASSLRKVVIKSNISRLEPASFGLLNLCEIIFFGEPPLVVVGDPFMFSQNLTIKTVNPSSTWANISSAGPDYPLNKYPRVEYKPSSIITTLTAKSNSDKTIVFQSDAGFVYNIESSQDLKNWTNYLVGIHGDDSLKTNNIQSTANKMFFRVGRSQ